MFINCHFILYSPVQPGWTGPSWPRRGGRCWVRAASGCWLRWPCKYRDFGSVTSRWPLISVCWSVGRLVGRSVFHNFLILIHICYLYKVDLPNKLSRLVLRAGPALHLLLRVVHLPQRFFVLDTSSCAYRCIPNQKRRHVNFLFFLQKYNFYARQYKLHFWAQAYG